ncbi:hypothetical protein [Rufibacter sp. LB8]|nr:hypothetical protein [Rufibacter sp. LB8]
MLIGNIGKYQFLKQAAALEYPPAFDQFLFLKPAFLELQPCENSALHYSLFDSRKKWVVACLTVHRTADSFVSPCQAPFGGVQHLVDSEVLHWFLELVEVDIRKEGATSVQLTTAPSIYASAPFAILTDILLRRGFSIVASEQHHYLPVEQGIPFHSLLSPAAGRRLKKCHLKEFKFRQEPLDFLPQAFSFLERCRKEKKQTLSLTLPKLQTQITSLPDHYFIFSLRDGEELVALSLVVKVNSEILYNFYPGSLVSYNHFSPAIHLTEEIYQFAQLNGYTCLDLGTSLVGGALNIPLMRFKRSLGGKESLKFIFKKDLK